MFITKGEDRLEIGRALSTILNLETKPIGDGQFQHTFKPIEQPSLERMTVTVPQEFVWSVTPEESESWLRFLGRWCTTKKERRAIGSMIRRVRRKALREAHA